MKKTQFSPLALESIECRLTPSSGASANHFQSHDAWPVPAEMTVHQAASLSGELRDDPATLNASHPIGGPGREVSDLVHLNHPGENVTSINPYAELHDSPIQWAIRVPLQNSTLLLRIVPEEKVGSVSPESGMPAPGREFLAVRMGPPVFAGSPVTVMSANVGMMARTPMDTSGDSSDANPERMTVTSTLRMPGFNVPTLNPGLINRIIDRMELSVKEIPAGKPIDQLVEILPHAEVQGDTALRSLQNSARIAAQQQMPAHIDNTMLVGLNVNNNAVVAMLNGNTPAVNAGTGAAVAQTVMSDAIRFLGVQTPGATPFAEAPVSTLQADDVVPIGDSVPPVVKEPGSLVERLVEEYVPMGTPVVGALVSNIASFEAGAAQLLEQLGVSRVLESEDGFQATHWAWFSSAILVLGGITYTAGVHRARRRADRVALGTDSVVADWESSHVFGFSR